MTQLDGFPPENPRADGPSSDDPAHQKVKRQGWWSFLQNCRDPLVLLNRQRRILMVNSAWENLTGRSQAEVRGWVCKRRGAAKEADVEETLRNALAPPPEVLDGNPGQARRFVQQPAAGRQCWDLHFFPLAGPEGLLGVLTRITVVPSATLPQRRPLPEAIMALRQQRALSFTREHLPSGHPLLECVRPQALLASRTTVPVALVGEAGTGKSWLARTIHQQSARREEFFASLDCGRLPLPVLIDVLFGQAWPRRLPLGGVYLRDPAALPREVQEELAQRLSTDSEETVAGDGPPRILAGFQSDPLLLVHSGTLLPSLFSRLCTLTISLPPLREYLPDWADLADRLLARASAAADKQQPKLSGEAGEILRSYLWPGNVQELLNVFRQACIRCKDNRLEAADLPYHLRTVPLSAERALPLDSLLEKVERRLLALALRLARNNKARAAEILGIWRPRLQRRIETLGLTESPGKQLPTEPEPESEG